VVPLEDEFVREAFVASLPGRLEVRRSSLGKLMRRSRLAAVLVSAALLVASCGGAPQSGAATPSAEPPATGQASPTEPPSVSPSPTPSPTSAPIAWSRLAWSDGVKLGDGQFVSDVVPWGDGYVGVGGVDTGSGLDVAFFTSTDGLHWTLAAREQTAQSNVWAEHVAAVGNRLLAVGQAVMNDPLERPDFPPPLWASDDGTTWRQANTATWDAAWSPNWPRWLVSSPRGIVAASVGTDPIVLFSTDGSTWTRATLPVAELAIASDAIAWSGGFVIVGRDGQPDPRTEACQHSCPPPGVGRPAAWISADGVHWSEASVEGNEVAGAGLGRVVGVAAGFLALGTDSTADYYARTMTSWTSSTGRSWSMAPGLQLPAGLGAYPVLAADGRQGVVIGFVPDASGLPVWVSSGRAAWTRVSSDAAPLAGCDPSSTCLRPQRAWIVPDGVILMATPGPILPETFWFATPS
jgi:hypothetical protein